MNLFDRGINYLGKTSQLSQAVLVAENQVAKLRAKAKDPANFPAGLASGWTADPAQPGFRCKIEADSTGIDTYTPTTIFETVYDPVDQRVIPGGIVPIRIRVAWGSNQELSVVTYISEPARPIDPLTAVNVAGGAGSLAIDATGDYTATFRDANNQVIPGVTFSWSLESIDGNATVLRRTSPRSGETVTIQHKYAYNFRNDSWGHKPGTVKLRAAARYNGVEYVGYSNDIVLAE